MMKSMKVFFLAVICLSAPVVACCAGTNESIVQSVTNRLALPRQQAIDAIRNEMKTELDQIQMTTSNKLDEINLKLKAIAQEPLDFRVRRGLTQEQKEIRDQFLQFHKDQQEKWQEVRRRAAARLVALDELGNEKTNQASQAIGASAPQPNR